MSDADDAANFFRSATDDERIEQFDTSTAKLMLKQFGMTPEKIRYTEYEYGEAFNVQWVVDNTPLDADVWVTRSFKYDVKDFLIDPRKSPIIKTYMQHIEENPSDDLPRFMVFKAYDIGRLVVMSEPPKERPYIHALIDTPLAYITTFNHLFSEIFGSDHDYE